MAIMQSCTLRVREPDGLEAHLPHQRGTSLTFDVPPASRQSTYRLEDENAVVVLVDGASLRGRRGGGGSRE